MPSSSKKQHNFMAAIAHSPAFAKKVGIPQSVGKDFDEADKGKKFGSGSRAAVQAVNKSKTDHGGSALFKKGGDTMAKMNPGFMAMIAKKKDGMHKMPDGKMMKNSAMKKMSSGGAMPMKDGKPAFIDDGKGMKKGGMAEGGKADMKQDKGMMQKAVNKHEGRLHKGESMTKLAKGGSAKFMSFSEDGKPAGMKSVKKMASGGSFRSAANGVATKGKTKGNMVKMKMGGKAC